MYLQALTQIRRHHRHPEKQKVSCSPTKRVSYPMLEKNDQLARPTTGKAYVILVRCQHPYLRCRLHLVYSAQGR